MNGSTKLLAATGALALVASFTASKLDAAKQADPTVRADENKRAAALTQPPRAPPPGRASGGRVEIAADSLGQFSAQVEIDGRRMKMLVDTGATFNGITAYDVQAIVLPRGASSVSLLGMSFLSKLGGFEVARGNLILKP
jgi:aspartyl protease family protein